MEESLLFSLRRRRVEDLRRYATMIGTDALINRRQRVSDALVAINAGLTRGEPGLVHLV